MKKMIKLFTKLRNSSGEVTIAVTIGIAVFTFSILLIQDFGNSYVKPYLDAKNNNPDAVVSIELSAAPRYESYIIENGVIGDVEYTEGDNEIQSIYDEESEIYANYAGSRNNKPKQTVAIKPSYTGEGTAIFDDGSTWEDLFPSNKEGDKWTSEKGQEKLIKITSRLINEKKGIINNFIAGNFLDNISALKNADIDKDINETIEEITAQNSTEGISSTGNKNIASEALEKIYNGLKNKVSKLTHKSRDIIEFIKEELQKKKMLADAELIRLRKDAERLELGKEYNEKIIKKYELLESQGNTVSDPSEWAEAKRRYEKALKDIKSVEEKINNLESQYSENNQDSSTDAGEQSEDTESTLDYEETATTTSFIEETTTSANSDTSAAASTTQAADNSNLPARVALKGGFEEGPGTITLDIDLNTGKVTGKVSSTSSHEGSIISWSGDLTGSINLENLEISGTGEGIVIVKGPEGSDGNGDLDCTFSGKLANDGSYADGIMNYTETWYGSSISDMLRWYASK